MARTKKHPPKGQLKKPAPAKKVLEDKAGPSKPRTKAGK